MNENLDLTKILKDVPKGTILYSSIYGNVTFNCITNDRYYPIRINTIGDTFTVTKDGQHRWDFDGECTLFPSKNQRDWSKFKTEPTFEPFQKVLVRNSSYDNWRATLYSHYKSRTHITVGGNFNHCIPYEGNEHLLGTSEKEMNNE